jgi:hypothetical protein
MSRPITNVERPRGETPGNGGYQPVQTYTDLRTMVFGIDLGELGPRKADTIDRVWGVVMEAGCPEAVATLLALSDGTVSLYFSSGGGMIGLGDHEEIANAAQRLIALAARAAPSCDYASEFPLPRKGYTRFYLMTYSGVLTVEIDEQRLWLDTECAPIFDRGHELLGMIRSISDELAEQKNRPTGVEATRPN